MYKSDKYFIGGFEVIEIGRADGPKIEVIPSKGGVLHQIFLTDEQIPLLDSFESPDDIEKNEKYKQTLLFPFPNRLKDGKYSFENTSYAFPLNEPDRNNALHGLVYGEPFVVTELDLTEDYGKIELTYLYHGQDEAYPFPFTLRVTYEISDSGFKLKAHVENTGYGVLPYGFGWHPYFQTDSVAKIGCRVSKLQKVNERMLPTGEEESYEFGVDAQDLTKKLDNAFRISNSESLEIDFGVFQGRLFHMSADESFRFYQIYNPLEQIIAVEPVTCNINALNNGDELIYLEKGDSREHIVEITPT